MRITHVPIQKYILIIFSFTIVLSSCLPRSENLYCIKNYTHDSVNIILKSEKDTLRKISSLYSKDTLIENEKIINNSYYSYKDSLQLYDTIPADTVNLSTLDFSIKGQCTACSGALTLNLTKLIIQQKKVSDTIYINSSKEAQKHYKKVFKKSYLNEISAKRKEGAPFKVIIYEVK